MSENIDKSLDQIMTENKTGRGGRARGRGRRVGAGRNTTAAPVGGIQKNRGTAKPAATKAKTNGTASGDAATGTDTKIIVSNLPRDVNETQIKDFFNQSVGNVKKVILEYGPGGQSRGRATIIFGKPGGANKAVQVNNGVLVDGKPMKIELVVDSQRAAGAKSLSDRITATKSAAAQPKSAAPKKDKTGAKVSTPGAGARGGKAAGAGARGRGAKAGRNARPKKKTAEQLDAEMTDYFGSGEGAASAAPAADADTGMDEVA